MLATYRGMKWQGKYVAAGGGGPELLGDVYDGASYKGFLEDPLMRDWEFCHSPVSWGTDGVS